MEIAVKDVVLLLPFRLSNAPVDRGLACERRRAKYAFFLLIDCLKAIKFVVDPQSAKFVQRWQIGRRDAKLYSA
jgi:hypothetical protein